MVSPIPSFITHLGFQSYGNVLNEGKLPVKRRVILFRNKKISAGISGNNPVWPKFKMAAKSKINVDHNTSNLGCNRQCVIIFSYRSGGFNGTK
jgi:hypothetical protein